MPGTNPGQGLPRCPKCNAYLKHHCVRLTPKNGGPKAPPCGWLICSKQDCRTVIRRSDGRVMPEPTEQRKQ